MNTIKQDFKEPHLVDVQRVWIRKPATIIISILVAVVIIITCLMEAFSEMFFEFRRFAGFFRECWRGSRD